MKGGKSKFKIRTEGESYLSAVLKLERRKLIGPSLQAGAKTLQSDSFKK
jgi:hypothetical protein